MADNGRKKHFGFSNWKEYILHLEETVAGIEDAKKRSLQHMEIANLWEHKLLQKAKAIVHYQQSFKADSSCILALENARRIYWDMGRLAPLGKLVALELEQAGDKESQALLFKDLAEALLILGQRAQLELACAEILDRFSDDSWALELLEDVTCGDNWIERAKELEVTAADTLDVSNRAQILFRAALLNRDNGGDSVRGEQDRLLRLAIAADYHHRGSLLLLETMILEDEGEIGLAELHAYLLESLSGYERAKELNEIGHRWLFIHGKAERAVDYLNQAWRLLPSIKGLLGFLTEYYVTNNTARMAVELGVAGLENAKNEDKIEILEVVANLLFSVLEDKNQAAKYFGELRLIDPHNEESGRFFEENEMSKDSSSNNHDQEHNKADEDAVEEVETTESDNGSVDPELKIDSFISSELETAIAVATAAEGDSADKGIKAWQEAWVKSPAHPVVTDALLRLFAETNKWSGLADFLKKQTRSITDIVPFIFTNMTLAQIYDDHLNQDVMVVNTYQAILKKKADYIPALDAAIVKYESMERWPDLVKMLKAKGALVTTNEDKVSIWLKVAQLFIQRFSNQAEAIKAFEEVLAADPDHEQAIEFLIEMYEKRRDWEKLIAVMQHRTHSMGDAEKSNALVDIAKLATERIKKPAVCISLWENVLEQDEENVQSFVELAKLYERAKEWEKLTGVLQKQADATSDSAEQIAIYQKLGIVFGDKVGDNANAVLAWKSLLELSPDDRRAQEQLKKRYLALQAWDELEEFYAATNKWDEFIRVLEREADKDGVEVAARVGMQFKIAELWRDKKERIDRSAKCYEIILDLDSANLKASQALIPIYEESGKEPAKLANVLEVQLGHFEDGSEKMALRQRIAHIAEDELEDMDRAFAGFLKVFKQAPHDLVTLDDMERVAEKAGTWEEVVEAYSGSFETASNAEEKFELRLRLARVLSEEVGRSEEALAHFDAILQDDPKNARAIHALERIFAQMGRYEELLDIYAKRIEMAEDDDERKDIYYNQALLWEEEIDDTQKAIGVYNTIIEMFGDETKSLSALDRLFLKEERWEDLANIIQREIDLSLNEETEDLEFKFRLGQINELYLTNKSKALECYREVLAIDSEHEKGNVALEGLLEDELQQAEAAEILVPLYETRENWEKLVEAIEILFKHSKDESEKLDYLLKKGTIFSQNLASPERAFVAYSRAFRHDPNEKESLEQLEGITAILDCYEEFVVLLEQGAIATENSENGKNLWLRAARIFDTQLDNIDSAINAYRGALKLDQQDAEAIAALEQIYSRTEKWSDLIDVLRTKVEVTADSADKEQIFRQMAMIFEEMLDRPEDAVGCMTEILNIDSSNIEALQDLDKLYVNLKNWTDLADNLQQQLGLESDIDNIVDLKLRLAGLRETRLEEIFAAVEIYREIIEIDAENSSAIEALERIIENKEFRKEVAEILEPIYRTLGQWEKLIGVIEIMISEEETIVRKVELLHEIANLFETAGDEPEKAFKTLGRALEKDPSEEKTQEELERMARVLDLYDDLVLLYSNTVKNVEDADLAAAYHLKIAEFCEEQLQDVDRSIVHYREVLAIDPMHIDAATALEGAYQVIENYDELAIIYLKKVEMVPHVDEQKELLFKASQIYEELIENVDKAIEVYLHILELDEDDLRAINQLEGLYLRLEKWDELRGIYNRKVDLVESSEEKKEVLYVLGAMYERKISDIKQAIETYQRILEFDPDDFQAIQRLDMLFMQTEEWHDLLSILEREVELTADPDEAVSYKFRIAELYVLYLKDVQRAVEFSKEILNVLPDHQPTIKLLEELIKGEEETLLAAEVLEPLYQDLAEWRKLIGVLEVKLAHTEDAWQKVELMHQAASLLESDLHLDAPSEAFDMYSRALEADNVNETTLAKLEELADQTNRFEDLAKLYDAQLENVVEVEPAVTLGLLVASIYEEKLSKMDEAIVRFKKVIEFDVENREAILSLDKLFQISEQWLELASVLQKEAMIMEEPEENLDVQFRLGQLYQQELEDVDKSIDVYRDILAAEPAHDQAIAALEFLFAEGQKRGEIVEILEPLHRMQNEWSKLIGLYERQLDDLEEKEDRIAMLYKIAETQEDKLLDPVEGFNWYCRAFSEEPFAERSGEEIERLAKSTEAWTELADLYQDLFAKSEDGDIKRFVAKRLARVSEEELHDAARAEQAYRSCLKLGGDDLDVLQALDRIYTQYMEWDRLVEILEMLVKVTPSEEEQITYIFRMGNVLETQIEEIEKARISYHRVVDELNPEHIESLERLEIIYANLEQWNELYSIYEKMKNATDSAAAQAELFAKMATIASDCLEDIPKSIEIWGNVLDILGEDAMALGALADLYSREENWSELVEILERAVTIAEDDEARVALYSQLGLVWGECLQRDRNALDNWQNVLSIDPENVPSLKAMAVIHEATQDWEALVETLHRIIEVGASQFETEEIKGYYSKLGTILSDTVDRPIDSIEAWQNAVSVDPSDVNLLIALEKLFHEQEMWEEYVENLGKKGELQTDDEQVETWLQQALAIEEKLEEPLRAKDPYLKILEVSPLHVHAFDKIVAIETEEETWEELNQLYGTRLDHVTSSKDEVKLLHNIAAIYEDKLDQADNAFQVMQRAFKTDYSNDETAKHLERLASLTDKWNDLLAGCNQVLKEMEDKKTQIDLCLKIGKWYADELGHPEYAIAYYQQVLTLDANNVAALKLMGELYRGTKQWPELVEVLIRAVGAEADTEFKKGLHVELGIIYEDYIENIAEARKSYEAALEIDPSMTEALASLEKMFAINENWTDLIPILRRKIEVYDETDTNDIVATHLRIAEILEINLDESVAAIEEYRKNLEFDQGHIKSLKGLERLFEKQEMWQDLLDIFEIELEYVTSERERIDLLWRISEMLEKEFVNPEKAIVRYEEILEIDISHKDALLALERLYKNAGKWQDLIATLEKHVDATHERADRVLLFEVIGQTYAEELDDIDRAMDAYKEVLDIDSEHEDSLDRLAHLQVKNEDWTAAHDTLLRLAETVSDPERKVDLYYRLGQLNEEHLMDRGTATEHFRSSLDIDPGHLKSLASLRLIHIDEGEWLAASKVLESEQENTENARHRSKLQFELGDLYRNKLSEEDLGIEWFEKALESDPDNQEAAEPLVDVYIETERWVEAEPLLDMLTASGSKRPSSEMQPLHSKLGLVADKKGDLDKALRLYQSAYDMDTSHLSALLNLADVLYRKEQWDKVFKLYQMVLVHHRDKQGNEEIVEIFYRLGNIKAQLKERRKALNMFDKALEINNGHVPTLEAVIRLQEEQKNFDQVIHFKKIFIDSIDDEDKKFGLYVEIGDIWQSKLKNPQKSISAYKEASEIKPKDRPVLYKLLPLYQSTKQWQNVVDVINRVTDMEENNDKKGRLFYSIGIIYRDEIKSADDAVDFFNKSLDTSLENLKAFEAIDRILTQKKDWKNLERSYRKMLHRIAGTDRKELEINLWHFLGEIYRSRMNQYEAAAEAFRMASSLDPDNMTRHEILAELYLKMPDKLDEAVAEHQALIKQNPYRVDSYKALRKLYFEHRQYDKAWCLCATLAFLKKADVEEQQFFEQYRTRGTIRAQARLDNERWIKDLFHPQESVYMGKIFELVTRAIRELKVQPIKAFGLKKNQKRPVNDTLSFSKTFFYSAQVLNLPILPELYIQEDKPGGLNFAVTDPMASACGASLLSGYTPQDLLFLVTKHLTYYRPEHYIRWILPTHAELKTLMLAALKIGAPDFAVPEDKTGVLQQWHEQLKSKLKPMEVENLRKVVARFLKSGEQADIKKWIRSLELTGCRVGFLLANDLETAAKMIQTDAGAVDDIPPKEKIKELVLFSVSEEYFRLRETLGIIIGS